MLSYAEEKAVHRLENGKLSLVLLRAIAAHISVCITLLACYIRYNHRMHTVRDVYQICCKLPSRWDLTSDRAGVFGYECRSVESKAAVYAVLVERCNRAIFRRRIDRYGTHRAVAIHLVREMKLDGYCVLAGV